MSRRPAAGSAGPGARGGVLLALAVVLGVVLLQAFDSGGGPSSVPVASGDDTIPDTTTTLGPVATTTTTLAARPPAEVKVLVVNGTGRQGVGGLVKDALQARGYNTLSAVTATSTLTKTSVQHEPGFEAEAKALAQLLDPPVSQVEPISSPPVKESDIRGANVIVLLGSDIPATATTAKASTPTTRASTATTRATTSTTRPTSTTKASTTTTTR